MPSEGTVMELVPYLNVDGAGRAIQFYKDAFGATERFRLVDPNDGRIGHAELEIGGGRMMISDEYPDFGAVGPVTLGGTPIKLVLTVADADSVFARAISRGATKLRAMRDEFHGNRTGQVIDPFGHIWFIQTQITDLTPEEMQSRWNATTAV